MSTNYFLGGSALKFIATWRTRTFAAKPEVFPFRGTAYLDGSCEWTKLLVATGNHRAGFRQSAVS